ncbi:hypothetical protein HBH56_107790 [Parastagonospora nodorum]|uniref:Uncharacterized protein n=1 Tax=Phaeosphaeria nodorum (strain SN15 / ATCC MYA-4574 / FGSC 10173) TaxID=321614 RepID=A0A7U2I7P5_PHANO|nr:hypothetical protein HBH56_107790 [Parastagonospora nodorum]QRD03142.1 hypothetical protein JI435_099110 [Parastagonospora nodorum SN15]KAH3922360.1 hypothetical protein HBH54_224890 [Parastagonospora nodorum]KAH4049055.1 hypothetical protein HBH49_154770 [Parastagonospora nodorum]KAH4065862.1 hypothetical protein HBH50_151640 [Parastagonospora nodorum]
MALASHQIIKTDRILRTRALADRSSLLVVRMGPRAQKQARELAADVISVLTKNGQRVLWNMSLPRSSERNWTMGDVFKSLLHQVLRDSAALFTQFTEQLNLEKIQAAHTDSEWADLICLLFAKVSDTFIVIETQDLRQVPQHDPESAKRLLQLLQRVANRAAAAGNPLKILLVVYGNVLQALTAASKDIDLVITSILPPPPVPPRLRHIARRAGLNMRGWKLQTPKV